MFSLKNFKIKLAYAGIASFFACLFVIIGMVVSDVVAQRGKFDKIECMSLNVVNANGEQRVALGSTKSGERGIWIFGKQERKRRWFEGKGKSEGNHYLATLLNREHGGIIAVQENFKDWRGTNHVTGILRVGEFGGRVTGRRNVFMEINRYGDGTTPIKDIQDAMERFRQN